MGLEVDIARSIVRRNKSKLANLPPEERVKAVNKIQNMLKERPVDDLIRIATERNQILTPALSEELQKARERTATAEQQALIAPRPEGEQALFTEQERGGGLPLSVQAARLSQRETEQEANLQRLGVETREELPTGSFELGFAANQQEGLSTALSEHFGKPVTVFKRGDDFLYLDPTDHIVKRANPDVTGKIGLALPITGDILGTVAGGMVTKGRSVPGMIAGETTGSGLGTASGEFARLLIGKAFGAHDLSMPQMLAKAGTEGGKASIATGAMGSLLASGKGIKNFLQGGVFTREDALKYGLSTEQADAAINEINKILRKKGVKGTLFTRTGDPVVGAKEAEIRRSLDNATEFMERDLSDQRAAKEALDIITKPGRSEGGAAVSEVLGKQVGRRIAQGKEIVQKNVDTLKNQLDEIGKVRKELVGEPTRKVITAKRNAARDAENALWDTVRKSGGYSEAKQAYGIEIPVGENVKELRRILDRRTRSALTSTTRRGASKVFSGKAKQADLADFNREISDLRSDIRAMSKNREFGTPQIRDLKAAETAMVEDRRLALVKAGREDLLQKIEAAEEATRKFNETYNRSVIGDLLERNDNGIFKIKDKDFVDSMLRSSGEEADQFLKVVGDKPSLVAKWKEGIADAYKRKAFKNNKFNKTASDEFIESHDDVLSRFFTDSEINSFRKTGDLAEKVAKQNAQLDRIVRVANQKWGRGKLKSLDPDNIVKFVTNDSGSFITPTGQGVQTALNKIKYIKNVTKNYPAAWRSFQEEYSTSLRNELLDNKTGFINPTKMANLVNNKADVVKEVMGNEYYKNLSTVNDVIQILSKQPKSLATSEIRAGIIQSVRAGLAPPLTRRGRAFTAAVLFDNRRSHKAVANALLEPESIKRMAKLAEHNAITREVAELAVSLGVIGAEDE